VYPAHGVGQIEAIEEKSVAGTLHCFLKINILESGAVIRVPDGQLEAVGLRRVIDKKTVEEVYDILRDRDVTVDTQTWNRRYREYTQKLKTGSLFEIASVIRDLSVLKSDKELSFGERKMLDTAQGLLVKEISIAKNSSEVSIKEEIDQICQLAA